MVPHRLPGVTKLAPARYFQREKSKWWNACQPDSLCHQASDNLSIIRGHLGAMPFSTFCLFDFKFLIITLQTMDNTKLKQEEGEAILDPMCLNSTFSSSKDDEMLGLLISPKQMKPLSCLCSSRRQGPFNPSYFLLLSWMFAYTVPHLLWY